MLIQTLDPAQSCGFAIGPAGKRPNSGTLRLRKDKDHRAVGCGNVIAYLCDTWKYQKPDVLAYEPPMTIEAWIHNARKTGRWHGGSGIQSASEINGAIMGVCERFGVRFEHVHRISVMTMITGKAGWGDPELNKKKVIEGLIAMKMLDPWHSLKDHDEADAVAIHVVASKKFGKISPRNFGLFSEVSD